MTCAALGLNEQAVKDYIRQNKPTYTQFEAWVKKNAKSLTPEAVEKHNAAVRSYIHDDETRKRITDACAVSDDASAAKDAVNLNNLDDWQEFHQAVLK
jgi:predicted transcriptional regulator